jgi:hypothetical protein
VGDLQQLLPRHSKLLLLFVLQVDKYSSCHAEYLQVVLWTGCCRAVVASCQSKHWQLLQCAVIASHLLGEQRWTTQVQQPWPDTAMLSAGGWEAALTNTLSPGDKIVTFRYGQFSHLWIDMMQRLGLDVTVIDRYSSASAGSRRCLQWHTSWLHVWVFISSCKLASG